MKTTKSLLYKIFLILILLIPAIALQFAGGEDLMIKIINHVQQNLVLYLFSLFFIKMIGIVYPPLPGAILTLSAVPFVGWKLAYMVDFLGSVTGVFISFYLGKRYGFSFLEKLVGKNTVEKIRKIKVKKNNQIESAFMLRVAFSAFSDGLAWGAGLIGFKASSFITGYALSHLVISLPIFYLVGFSTTAHSIILFFIIILISWFVLYKFKGRYFE